MSAEKSKKAEAFASAWSPKNSEIRSPGGSPSGERQSLASPKASVSATATAAAIMRAAEEVPVAATTVKESLKQSPRKSIDAFLQATPPKPADPEPKAEPTLSASSAVTMNQTPKQDGNNSLVVPAAALAVIIVAVLIAQMM
jgi:hypothetical protein